MRILGVSDGLDAGAALAVDDRLVAAEVQAAFDGQPRSRAFPWEAMADVLRRTRSTPAQIDTIAVAGRFSPPFFLRRHPGARRMARDPFSSAFEVGVFYQAMLRQTGMGALEASRAADWLGERFASRGFRARVVMVDVHTALANAAYRTQPDDDVLLMTLHPMGDGVSLAVHRGTAGQIDRVFEQRGFSSLHVHLFRCAAALGCPHPRAMWALARQGQPDPALLGALAACLRPEGGRLSRLAYPLPEDPAVYARLRAFPPEVAAAAVHENLRAAVAGVLAHHVRATGIGDVAVAGEVFEDPRLVAALAEVPGVRSIRCPAEPGSGALAVGAAAYVAGTRTDWFDPTGEDPEVGALGGQRLDLDQVAELLGQGRSVGWASGASGPLSFRSAERCVLRLPQAQSQPSADDPAPRTLWAEAPQDGRPLQAEVLGHALRTGAAAVRVGTGFAVRYPAQVGPDQRALVVPAADATSPGEQALAGVLARLQDAGQGGCLVVHPLPGRPAQADTLRRAVHQVGCAGWVAGERWLHP